ncbi:hypothetical protein LY78DRAFT_14253 [Colletotrichum sublineola]|nr:hypothetical protein LY78DRAFT_14253 [Colletotrichum sublineola]
MGVYLHGSASRTFGSGVHGRAWRACPDRPTRILQACMLNQTGFRAPNHLGAAVLRLDFDRDNDDWSHQPNGSGSTMAKLDWPPTALSSTCPRFSATSPATAQDEPTSPYPWPRGGEGGSWTRGVWARKALFRHCSLLFSSLEHLQVCAATSARSTIPTWEGRGGRPLKAGH